MKRFDRKMIGFLPREQMLAVIDVPTETWIGQRDQLLLTLMFNTGAGVSEIIGVRVADVVLGPTSSIRLNGKGRKQRSLPLWKTAARAVRDWLHINPQMQADAPLLPRRAGKPMTARPREPIDDAHVRRSRPRDEGTRLGTAEAARDKVQFELLRPCACMPGRKAWLFAGSELAGQRAAVVMSLVQSAKLNGLDPWAYLKDVLIRLPMHLNSRIEELLPHRWQPLG